jgi:hypothetical protein
MRRILLAAALGAASLGLAGCLGGTAPAAAPAASPAVILWGDSFGESVAPYLPYEERVHGGTSPCTWRDNVASAPAPRTAVLVFVGNDLLNGKCDWRSAVAAITTNLRSRGSRVVWIAAPVHPDYPTLRAAVNALLASPAHGPANSIGGDFYLPEYRGPDGYHLNSAGAHRFAQAIRGLAG